MKTILIVEDIDLNIDLLTQILEDNYTLLIARDGAKGVEAAVQNHPDLVLMDISLPVMDGYEATRRIRLALPALPVIGISANAMQTQADQALAAGCNDYLTKPVDEDLLLKTIKKYLD